MKTVASAKEVMFSGLVCWFVWLSAGIREKRLAWFSQKLVEGRAKEWI